PPTYVAANKNLTITFAGSGSGTVTIGLSSPSGTPISCTGTPNPCIQGVDNSQTGTLSATANAGSVFAGWSLASAGVSCSGTTSPCNYSMGNNAQSVTATFNFIICNPGGQPPGCVTATATNTNTPTATPTKTNTPTATQTATNTATSTNTPTNT